MLLKINKKNHHFFNFSTKILSFGTTFVERERERERERDKQVYYISYISCSYCVYTPTHKLAHGLRPASNIPAG